MCDVKRLQVHSIFCVKRQFAFQIHNSPNGIVQQRRVLDCESSPPNPRQLKHIHIGWLYPSRRRIVCLLPCLSASPLSPSSSSSKVLYFHSFPSPIPCSFPPHISSRSCPSCFGVTRPRLGNNEGVAAAVLHRSPNNMQSQLAYASQTSQLTRPLTLGSLFACSFCCLCSWRCTLLQQSHNHRMLTLQTNTNSGRHMMYSRKGQGHRN